MADKDNVELWSSLNNRSKDIEKNIDALNRKRTGSYYTDIELTDEMMHELVETMKLNKSKKIYELTFLEPCVGSGNFVFSYIKYVNEIGLNKDEAEQFLNNIYVIDVNEDALNGYKESLIEVASSLWKIKLKDDYFETHMGKGVLIDVTQKELKYIPITNVFPDEIIKDGFDVIATNPPYKNLKAERSQYNSEDEYEKDQLKYNDISKIVKRKFNYSSEGVLNLYKLFVEEIIEKYANPNGYISLLIPTSIMSDKTSMKLRTQILTNNKLISIKVIDEANKYIDAQQALCTFLIKKGESTNNILITKDFCNNPDDIASINIEDILNRNTGNAIIAVTSQECKILNQLRKFPTIKDLDFIINLRGELDLTANKKYITDDNTDYKLIRGRHIDYYNLTHDSEKEEYVLKDFIEITTKKKYIKSKRIACQQIANMKKERRVKFTLIPPDYVLGNSCNFISVEKNEYGIDIYTILGLLNSKIINWLFKLTSSNNHINNYEIDGFPIPVYSKELTEISRLTKKYLKSNDESIINEIEKLVSIAYGIDENKDSASDKNADFINEYYNAIKFIVQNISQVAAKNILLDSDKIENYLIEMDKFDKNVAIGITNKYKLLYQGKLLNHTTFKLSDLDLEMIKNVPQGGNWKNIPMKTVEKSKRLKRITQTGGRTTLYGRIDYDKPSYTITTYFNRPGNGTYVHPVHERVLSVREAARFQGFKDDYYFFGNKTQHLKQIGNAVPTLLAYQIGNQIRKKTGCSKSIDLFCGAGGMTAGFKAAGIKSLLSNDIEESACTTLKINNPEIKVLCGDITKTETKDLIEKAAKEGEADIICGGPPCQGFSMAGFRSENDPRNQLFREFVDIVKRVNPKVIVFENVEGLLSYQGGKTYREVHTLFGELGYNTEGRTLLASNYAVPQKRKRVIIICTRKDIEVEPADLFPNAITSEESEQVTARETISDLENVLCGEDARYDDVKESSILKFFKGKISYEEFVNIKTPKENNKKRNTEQYKQISLIDLL